MKAAAIVLGTWLGLASLSAANATNGVANSSFEESTTRPGSPDAWAAAGDSAVQQLLTLDTGPDGRRCAKLACTAFTGDGPAHHAMLCQVGQVRVRQGQ